MAFPAILPASLTLLKDQSGRRAASDDARGAMVGSLALLAFALAAAGCASRSTVPLGFLLVCALSAWLIVAFALWWLLLGRDADGG